MQNNPTLFQICQKIVVFDEQNQTVLLARRKGEADLDGLYSFIGGKLETTDNGITAGLDREKTEEIGTQAKLTIFPEVSWNTFFIKKDGNQMFLPHYYARYDGGEIQLNTQEYADYKWVKISELEQFEPKIPNIPHTVTILKKLHAVDEKKRGVLKY